MRRTSRHDRHGKHHGPHRRPARGASHQYHGSRGARDPARMSYRPHRRLGPHTADMMFAGNHPTIRLHAMYPELEPPEAIETYKKSVQKHLKRCPLCDTLNALQNDECVTCGWSGQFIRSQVHVVDAFLRLLQRCPGLSSHLNAAARTPRPRHSRWALVPSRTASVWQRLSRLLRQVLGRRTTDFRA